MTSCRWPVQRMAHVIFVTLVSIVWDSNHTFPARGVGLFCRVHEIKCSDKQEVAGGWDGRDLKLGETRNYTKFCWGKPQGKRLHERSKRRWKNSTKVDPEGMSFEALNRIVLGLGTFNSEMLWTLFLYRFINHQLLHNYLSPTCLGCNHWAIIREHIISDNKQYVTNRWMVYCIYIYCGNHHYMIEIIYTASSVGILKFVFLHKIG
jgi:hypothetical protein